MSRGLRFLALAVAVASLALGCNAEAKADDNVYTYLTDMSDAGFVNTGGNMAEIQVGYGICSDLKSGISASQEAHDLWHVSQLPSLSAAQLQVSITIRDLCPTQGV